MKLWFKKVIKIQCLETFKVLIIINYKTLKYSPGIAPKELSKRCWDVWHHRIDMSCTSRQCPMRSHTFSVHVFSSSLEFFLLLHYRQAKCIIYCLSLNRACFYFDDKCSDTKIKEFVACNQNKKPLYIQLHTSRYVWRFKREQMPSLISFWGVFNLKVWFLWLLINPCPVYLQTKDFSYQNRFHIPFEWFEMPSHLYTLNSL